MLPRNDERQCVRNDAGFVARVRWYKPTDFATDAAQNVVLIKDRVPVKNETIRALQRSCIQESVKMSAIVSIEGGSCPT